MILFYMFILATMAFVMEFNHMLSSLACLEFIALIIFVALATTIFSLFNEISYSLMYIAIAVCEAALGLSIVVAYVNKKGNEMIKTF